MRLSLAERAAELRREGRSILRLDTMDSAVFDLPTPEPILLDMVATLPSAQGYSDHQGTFPARRAVALHYATVPDFPAVDISDVWIGNGASELILMSLEALVNDGDEILIPRPSEAIWPSATLLAGGTPVYYDCDEQCGWNIHVEDIAALISDRSRAIVISHPNNPTGRVYPSNVLAALGELCANRGLVMLSDETLGRVIYPPAQFTPAGVYAKDTLCLTFDSLSFGYRAPGYRAGWMVVSGARKMGRQYLRALSVLSELRRSPNTLGQSAIQVALGGRQTISELTAPGGRLWEQREAAVDSIRGVDGADCIKPDGGFSLFVDVHEDYLGAAYERGHLAFDLLESQQVLVEPADCFSMTSGKHFRVTFLARERTFNLAAQRIGHFLHDLREESR
jgi:alanine-synthesizing transaminase